MGETDPTNADRAERARQCALTYQKLTRRQAELREPLTAELGGDFADEVIGDLICDLLHLARECGAAPISVLDDGRTLFEAEEADEAYDAAQAAKEL